MAKEQIESIISMLENVKNRPGQFIGTSEPHDVWRFIAGFHFGLAALGVVVDHYTFYQQVVQDRGWQWSAAGIIPTMKEQGFSDDDISNEMLLIEIESRKRLL